MNNFIFGAIIGASIIILLSYTFPQSIRPVNEELVKHGMAHYDIVTKKCIWNTKDK